MNVSSNITAIVPPFSPPVTGLIAFLSATTSLITVLGNLLVVTAFFVERALRTPTNYFIASLAVTDLLIGVFSMNFFTVYLLLGEWPIGKILCDIWLSLDYTACLTSQYTVFFITVDRFCSVKIPAKYRNWRTDRKVIIMVAATWFIPSSIFFTSIMGWPFFTDANSQRAPKTCYAEFTTQPIFNLILTICYFWITLVVMIGLYSGIYHVALNLQRKSDAKRRKMTSLVSMAGQTMSRIGVGVSKANDGEEGAEGDEDDEEDEEDDSSSRVYHETTHKSTQKAAENHGGAGANQKRNSRLSKNYQTTSFTQRHKGKVELKEEERSSSPMLPSDSENVVDYHPACSPPSPCQLKLGGVVVAEGGGKNQPPESTKCPLLATIESPKLLEVPTVAPPLLGNGGGGFASRSSLVTVNHHSFSSPRLIANPTPTTSNDSDYHTASGLSLDPIDNGGGQSQPLLGGLVATTTTDEGTESNNNNPSLSHHVYVLSAHPEQFEGLKYIDQDSLKSLTSCDNVKLLLEIMPQSVDLSADLAGGVGGCGYGGNPPSPVWKKRLSGPNTELLPSSPFNLEANANNPADETVTAALLKDGSNGGADNNCKTSAPVSPIRETNNQQQLQRISSNNIVVDTNNSGGAGKQKKVKTKHFIPSLRAVTNHLRRRRKKKEKVERGRSENRARKALKTITLILGAFVACWTPYHILVLIKGFCDRPLINYTCVNDHLFNLSYWLCYINSPINPFCYALANIQFKKTFTRLFRLDFHRT